MTPWPQFGTLDPVQVARKLHGKLVLDPYAVLKAVACRARDSNTARLGWNVQIPARK